MSDDTPTSEDGAPESAEVAVATEAPPRDERREELAGRIGDALGDAVVATQIEVGRDLCVRVAPEAWGLAAEAMRNVLRARYFCFLSAIDWMPSPFGRSMDSAVDLALGVDLTPGDADAGADEDAAAGDEDGAAAETPAAAATMQWGTAGGETRFQVLARVASVGTPGEYWGVTLKADVPDDLLSIDTWTRTYAGADWHEREAWEMFGITFVGHPGLRHMYLPGDFEGNPLRKDFPLLARMVKPWPGIVDVEPMPEIESGSAAAGGSEDPAGSQPPTDAGSQPETAGES